MKNIFPRLLGIAFLIAAVTLIVGSIQNYAAQHQQTDWPTTEATVTDIASRVERSGNRRHRSRTVYDLTYAYEVDGQTYERQLKGAPQLHLVGDSLTIKYDPDTPESSTTILSPQFLSLLIPLLMGFVFGTIGFFASGLSRLFRRGKPKEEEILPPEEYVNPEEDAPSPRRRRILQRIIPLIMFALFLAANLFLISSGAQPVTAAQFSETVADHGYTTTDTTEQYRTEWRIGSMLEQSVTLEIPGVRINFCKVDSTSGARSLYGSMELPVSGGTEKNSLNREAVIAENDELFTAKIRVSSTIVYTTCHPEDKRLVLDILHAIGYWE